MTDRPASLTGREREYSPSTRVASLDDELRRYATISAAVAARTPPRPLAYGAAPDERLLVIESAPGAPLHVFVHGGYWQALGAGDSLFPAAELLVAGRSYAAVEYTLAPAATIGEIVEQCLRAVEVVVAELSPSSVTLSGSSAGAHLAAHVAQRTRVRIDRLVLLSGIYRLGPLVGTYVNDALGLDASTAEQWSVPLQPRPAAQVLVLHGEHETAAFKAQSARLAAAWGVPVVEVVGRNHFDLVHDLASIDLRPGVPAVDGPAPDAAPARPIDPNGRHHDEPQQVAGAGATEASEPMAAAEHPGAPRRLEPDALRPSADRDRLRRAAPAERPPPAPADGAIRPDAPDGA